MRYLKMYIGRVFFDKIRLRFFEKISQRELEEYYSSVVSQLMRKHHRTIQASGMKPKFFIEMPSKMNDMVISDEEMQEFEQLIKEKRKKHAEVQDEVEKTLC